MIYFKANFNTPIKNINTLITTRFGGHSISPYNSFNIATHVGDNLDNVMKNRQILNHTIKKEIIWLNQTHSDQVLDLINNDIPNTISSHDAVLINNNKQVASIMTADCKVLLVTNKKGEFVMAIHAGWQGVLNGIIFSAINSLVINNYNLNDVYVYFGPSICSNHFIIKDDVRDKFITSNRNYSKYITSINNASYKCDLDAIVIDQLVSLGLNKNNFSFSNFCTMCRSDLFFSYRLDGNTGRIASLIWIDK
jgi:YfiH family protein